MRDYQVQGLNWMVGLHFNGINGILADEMVRGSSSRPLGRADLWSGSRQDAPNHRLPRLPEELPR
jgi:hypothetical protein